MDDFLSASQSNISDPELCRRSSSWCFCSFFHSAMRHGVVSFSSMRDIRQHSCLSLALWCLFSPLNEGHGPGQVFLTLPSGLLSYCICTSRQYHSILLTLITFSSQDWVTGWGEWGQKSKMQDIPTCQLWINNLAFNLYPCSKWIVKIPVVVTFVELRCRFVGWQRRGPQVYWSYLREEWTSTKEALKQWRFIINY